MRVNRLLNVERRRRKASRSPSNIAFIANNANEYNHHEISKLRRNTATKTFQQQPKSMLDYSFCSKQNKTKQKIPFDSERERHCEIVIFLFIFNFVFYIDYQQTKKKKKYNQEKYLEKFLVKSSSSSSKSSALATV